MITIKIILNDEVNCSIAGLPVEDRRILSNKFKYEVPGARFTPTVRLGRWDGKIGFFSIGGDTYINLLPEILPLIKHYKIELEDKRKPANIFFDPVTKDSYSHITWPKTHTLSGKPVILRDQQVEAINKFLENPQCVQSASVGLGKTIITAILSHKCEKYGRTFIIVPNRTLVNQTETDYTNMGLDVGVYFGTKKEYTKTHTICTWQSLGSLIKRTKDGLVDITFNELINNIGAVIVDETHTAKGQILKDMLTKNFNHVPIRWGLTGSLPPDELGQKSILVGIGETVNMIKTSDLQEADILANCQVHIRQIIEHGESKNYQKEHQYLHNDKKRLKFIGQMINDIGQTGNTLILVDRIVTGEILRDVINEISNKENEDDVVFISGKMKESERKRHYDSIRTSKNKIMIATSHLASTGLDMPRIFNVVLFEPGKSFIKVIQSIGRGVRKSHDKDFVNIYDITSTSKYAKKHLTARKKIYREANFPFTVEKVDYR